MPVNLTWNEMRDRAARFVSEWEAESNERAESQTFWNEFFEIFGIRRRRVALYEQRASRLSTGRPGRIDVFWPSHLVAEHKSRGAPLEETLTDQALDYLDSLAERDLPIMVVASDFARFRYRILDTGEEDEFPIEELPQHLDVFQFMAGYRARPYEHEVAVDVKAAELLGRLHDSLVESRYGDHDEGHNLRVLLVRVLFLLFGDDSGLWERGAFHDWLLEKTREDGSDTGQQLTYLFSEVLDTPQGERQRTVDEALVAFPYVDGGLFAERIRMPAFNAEMRNRLLDSCRFDWSAISPAIFGSLFQSVMKPEARRHLGAHYTSEKNILKALDPLFLDDLRRDLEIAGTSRQKLNAFLTRLASIRVFDPACGCGNFLVLAYREMRRMEREALLRLQPRGVQQVLDVGAMRKIGVGQFYGVEIEEFPARIAEVAMYLVDHLENVRLGEAFGVYYAKLPLEDSATIVVGNALCQDWKALLPPQQCSFVVGNPPYVGKKVRDTPQQADLELVFGGAPGTAILDYVAAWYEKAAHYIAGTAVRVAFVSTNSITQGQQVPVLWPRLLNRGITIGFAHRTFEWTSEARGAAHVHVVIIGFSEGDWPGDKHLYEYVNVRGEPLVTTATQINPYLLDAPVTFVTERRHPLANVPRATFGSMPNDGGHLVLDEEEAEALREADPIAARYLREMASARQMLHGDRRWCLWLTNAPASDIRSSTELRRRVAQVRAYREASSRQATRRLAQTPHLFGEIRQPTEDYLCVPRHAAESRVIIPMQFLPPTIVASDSTIAIPGADLVLFGLMQSAMFTAWVRTVGGRIKNDLRFSAETVYNTFPFATATDAQRKRIEAGSQAVLDARSMLGHRSLQDLYDPLAMPAPLVVAHRALDAAIDRLYSRRTLRSSADRLAVLFDRYTEATTNQQTMPVSAPTGRRRHRPRGRPSARA